MSNRGERIELPVGFQGPVRLLAQPHLVMFPHAMQPLRLTEPDDCALLDDALAGDRLIAMATWHGGPLAGTTARPALHPAICLCQVVSQLRTPEQHHNILLVGVKRARLTQEVACDRPYRTAMINLAEEVDAMSDVGLGCGDDKRQLLQAFAESLPETATVQQNLHELMCSHMDLAAITDIIAFTSSLPLAGKLALLAESDAGKRARLLVEALAQLGASPEQALTLPQGWEGGITGFPPRFSLN